MMRIGGATRDSMMTLIPLAGALVVATVLLGGPENALRALEGLASDAWRTAALWVRR
jgi:hypothetical protein